MKKYKAIIADDEYLVRERISNLLKPYDSIDISAQCPDGASTMEAIKACSPDLLFLDIRMPKASGFDVLEQCSTEHVLVIFITAFDQYAIKAFEYAAFDYLLKPITEKRFSKTLKRVLNALANRQSNMPHSIVTRNQGVVTHIQVSDITHLEASDNHVVIHGKVQSFKKRTTLRKITEELAPFGFVQVHRSFTIHPQHIQEMVRIYQGDYLIRLTNSKVVPTSKSFRENVKKLYG